MSGGRQFWERLARLLGRDRARELEEELRYHLEQRERDYLARGMNPESARRAAHERLGNLDGVRRTCEGILTSERMVSERRARARVSWLDVKLGLRMLGKYPGVSLVSVLGMAVAVALGAGAFGSIWAVMNAELPIPAGDEVVALELEDARAYGSAYRQILHDFVIWRGELRSVEAVSAFRGVAQNLIADDGSTELVRVAEITGSGMALTRVPPLLGRPILESDEEPGAESVVVIGHDEWQRRFGGEPDVLGRTVQLGDTRHTVVGVMPAGFRFPQNDRLWTAFRLDPALWERGSGPRMHVFGRLAEGTTLESAQAELGTVGEWAARAYPETHQHLRARVKPYTLAYGVDVDSPDQAALFRSIPFMVALLLVLVSVNVSILVYARTATRIGEISVRSALGASRGRIVSQLFVEALVLSVIAAAAGLTLAGVALERIESWMRGITEQVPYWWDFGVSPGTAAYVAGLAVLAGVIVGVIPALKATGRGIRVGLQQAAGRGGMQLGRTWTGLIVAQVAVAVAVLPFAVLMSGRALAGSAGSTGYAAEELLRAGVSLDVGEPPAGSEPEAHRAASEARFHERAEALMRRLEAEPTVAAVTYARTFPGGGRWTRMEAEGAGLHDVQVMDVAPGFFDVIGAPPLAGREFRRGEGAEGDGTVVVDQRFAEEAFGGSAAVGRRVRYLVPRPGSGSNEVEPGPWLEIVGVAPEFGVQLFFEPARPKVFEPLPLSEAAWFALVVRMRGDARGFAGPLRDIAAAVDPRLLLNDLRTAASHERTGTQALRFIALAMMTVTVAVLLLSAAGIYAMMSFTVARRRREIGIRSALGASRGRVLHGIFGRAGAQLGAGVGIGLALAFLLDRAMGGGPLADDGLLLLPAVAALMTAVGLLAAFGPARRGLAVEPSEVLRED